MEIGKQCCIKRIKNKIWEYLGFYFNLQMVLKEINSYEIERYKIKEYRIKRYH